MRRECCRNCGTVEGCAYLLNHEEDLCEAVAEELDQEYWDQYDLDYVEEQRTKEVR